VIWKGISRRTVFILGAGATRGAFSHVRVNGKKVVAPLNWDFFNIAKSFVKAQVNDGFRDRYYRIRKVFQEEFPTRGRWPIPMEVAFSLLYVSKDLINRSSSPELVVPFPCDRSFDCRLRKPLILLMLAI